MRLSDPNLLEALAALGIERQPGASLSERTSLGIGGATDLLLIKKHAVLPDLVALLRKAKIPYRFLGGGTNLLVRDGELPWVVLQLERQDPEVRLEGNMAWVDAAADLGRTVTYCAKHDLGGMEGLIGVPGTVGGALRMNAGAYGMQIGSYVREVKLYRAATRQIEILRGEQISFEYRHTSFAPDDMMLAVRLELPSKPFKEILQGIRICNEKRRSSQPLGQKSAGCIFKNPPGKSAGRMIDELGLKGLNVGDARISDRHAPSCERSIVSNRCAAAIAASGSRSSFSIDSAILRARSRIRSRSVFSQASKFGSIPSRSSSRSPSSSASDAGCDAVARNTSSTSIHTAPGRNVS